MGSELARKLVPLLSLLLWRFYGVAMVLDSGNIGSELARQLVPNSPNTPQSSGAALTSLLALPFMR
jgi:hypothetical protein